MIAVRNHGAILLWTTYWTSDLERAGQFYVSVNAGAIRILVPRRLATVINEWRPSDCVICSRGPWPDQGVEEAVELLFEDGTDAPFALHLTPASFDMLPGPPNPGREWVLSAWVEKKGRPHKALERPCRWRRVPELPWLKQWEDTP